MSKNDTISAEEYHAISGKQKKRGSQKWPTPIVEPQKRGKVELSPHVRCVGKSDTKKDGLETLKTSHLGSANSDDLEEVKKEPSLLVMEGISIALKKHGMYPAYTEESPDKIKLITTGKSYLITIKEV